MTTDKSWTPRTINASWTVPPPSGWDKLGYTVVVNVEFARQLETELNQALASLAEANREIERLRKIAAHVKAFDYIKAAEAAGYKTVITSLDAVGADGCKASTEVLKK